jgi:hypothetical protein
MPLSLNTTDLRDALLKTLEVRRGIEAEASVVAARRRTEKDIATIEEKLNEMERVHLAKGTSGPEDLAFHLAIYDATHNSLFRQLLEQMREAFERFWEHPFDRQDFARRSFPFHRELFDAIVEDRATFLGMHLSCSPTQASSEEGVRLCAGPGTAGGVVPAIPYYLMVALMVGSTWYQQRQMQRASAGPGAQQAQLMARIMPVFLGVISISISAGWNGVSSSSLFICSTCCSGSGGLRISGLSRFI